ncbi:protein of unknown function [Ruminococcus sp. YE71]|uniref:DUF4258 domain-containing protein n=1 Tax=unclassified Ruminococcus TaxID=2608920 RepID=UPI00088BCA05|nr:MULTISPECIES: DUF4258 domain-containing protein [unclassified Ruminococcus]SDA31110.1 protein of unknown function [Ruminococcus sp. YE78]SFW51075.1 protein of unknown function [Ruminococcus sp. YE71]
MLDIEELKRMIKNDDHVIVSGHAAQRLRVRGIRYGDIVSAVDNGEIIEQYPEDYPYPSCLVLGMALNKRYLHVVCGSDGEYIWIITAYYPSEDKWLDDYKTRRS